jgi:hypothetical protein
VNSLLSGLCGKFAAAFVDIAEPFIVCNMWDCGEDYNVSHEVIVNICQFM